MVPEPGVTPSGEPEGQPAPSWPEAPPAPAGQPQYGPLAGSPYPPASTPAYPQGPYPPVAYPQAWPDPGPAPKPSALPVEQREFHEFFRAPRFRWWKPILSIGMFAVIWLGASLILPSIAFGIDLATGRLHAGDLQGMTSEELTKALMTPFGFTANNLALALSIPAAGLTAWAVYGQRPRWMSSIAGGFRWHLLWRFVLVAMPVFLLGLGLDYALGSRLDFHWNNDSLFLIIAILLTTPFQSAGEEYAVRGLFARSIGSWFGWRRLGLVVSAVLSALLFMLLHVADNVWLNIYYFSVGIICSVLIWRTGGLEAAVALHLSNNLVSEITLPFGGLESMFDRGPSSAGPEALIQLVFTLAVMAGMLWVARRRALPRTAAPAAPPLVGANLQPG